MNSEAESNEMTWYDTIMVTTCHDTFVQTHNLNITRSERSCKGWTLGDRDVTV